MKTILQPHTPINNITIHTTLNFTNKRLFLSFKIEGLLENYIFPKEKNINRANELWKATCFELFLADSKKEEYYELNFSPSKEWNFYHLNNYRTELEEVEEVLFTIDTVFIENRYEVKISLEPKEGSFPFFDIYNSATILLTSDKKRTFWSLNKMKDIPDFHCKDFFNKF